MQETGRYISERAADLRALAELPRFAQIALAARLCQRALSRQRSLGLYEAIRQLAAGERSSSLEPHLSDLRKYIAELDERGREPNDDYPAMWRADALKGVLQCVDAVPMLLSDSKERRSAGCDEVVQGAHRIASEQNLTSTTMITQHFWTIFPLLHDLDLLKLLAQSEQWDDLTPVDVDVLGAPFSVATYDLKAWRDAYIESNEPTGDSELVIEIDVPESATDDDVLQTVREFVELADGLHRAYGGTGLDVKTVECFENMNVLAGGPR